MQWPRRLYQGDMSEGLRAVPTHLWPGSVAFSFNRLASRRSHRPPLAVNHAHQRSVCVRDPRDAQDGLKVRARSHSLVASHLRDA